MLTRRSCLRFLLGFCVAPAIPAAGAPRTQTLVDDLLGTDTLYETVAQDTLPDIAARFDLGYVETVAANPGIDPWLPPAGSLLQLPTAHLLPPGRRRGIVVNLGAMRLFAFLPGRPVMTFPIGTGVDINMTPTGTTTVASKQTHPTWYPPAAILQEDPSLPKSIPPGPDDPLGDFILLLGWPDYGIHGTNKPYGIGRHVSHGCIRLYPDDIAALYPLVPVGTPVSVVDEHAVFGWSDGELYLQVYPDHAQSDALEVGHAPAPAQVPDLTRRAIEAADIEWRRLDWDAIEQTATERRGLAIRITR